MELVTQAKRKGGKYNSRQSVEALSAVTHTIHEASFRGLSIVARTTQYILHTCIQKAAPFSKVYIHELYRMYVIPIVTYLFVHKGNKSCFM
jgi:hypothetical protein